MPSRRSIAVSGGAVAALVLASGAFTLLPGAAPRAAAEALVPYSGCGQLLEHYRDQLAQHATAWGGVGGPVAVLSGAGAADSAGAREGAAAALPATGPGATGTNLQEQGVDEPDTAKTVGGVLYAVAQSRLQLVRTGARPTLLGSLRLGEDIYGAELLIQDDRVLVVLPGTGMAGGDDPRIMSLPAPGGGRSATRLLLIDVQDPAEPRLLETLDLDGRYLSARLSDGAVRLVTASAPQPGTVQPAEPYGPAQEKAARAANVTAARSVSLDQVLPSAVRRNATGQTLSQGRAVACDQVRYAPSSQGDSTLLVTTLDPGRSLAAVDQTAVTTDGELVYASADRLYVATSRWGTTAPAQPSDDRPQTSTSTVAEQVTTELHAFDTTSPTSTPYAGSASVDGYVMGRWALSSHQGHLRVATTSAAPWGAAGEPSTSSVVVLDEGNRLAETGRVGGLGVGERIFAVRYFGDLATVVTFRQTDPLYVLDLADPAGPRLLGELKVPGFSTYLHPVGKDRLLGVGQDADAQGRVTGFQVSLFDLSDRSRPVQLDRLSLGQGYSPAGDDSRAFGYDPERGLALLPFTTWSETGGGTSSALGIRVGADGTLAEAGRLPGSVDSPVERVLHDTDTVYAISQGGVLAGTSTGLATTGRVAFAR